MSLQYIRENRKLPFVKRGMLIEVDGKRGKITAGNSSGNINVRFDGKKKIRELSSLLENSLL